MQNVEWKKNKQKPPISQWQIDLEPKKTKKNIPKTTKKIKPKKQQKIAAAKLYNNDNDFRSFLHK